MKTEMTRREEARPETVQQERWFRPAVDVYENDGEWLIVGDLPGVTQDHLRVNLENDELTIEGRREFAGSGAGAERFVGYRRAFTLPSGIDAEKVQAKLNLGVVSIHLPKSAAIRPRRIEVKAG